MVARRDDTLMIVKVLSNVDAFSRDNAEEMKVLAEALEASPLLVGERSGSGKIEEGIVYSRFSVPIIAVETLADYLMEGVPPFIFAAPGGLYVKLDSPRLKSIREERNISLGTLAEVAGVSRRTIQMYESGMGAMIDAALRLEEYLDESLVLPIDPLAQSSECSGYEMELQELDIFSKEIFEMLSSMGFSILPTVKCPFEALTSDDDLMFLTGLGKDERKLKDKARMVTDISRITEKRSVIFIERIKSKGNVEGTALIGRDELKKLVNTDKLLNLVEDRSDPR
jgi:putative transcriptional regulator